MANVTSNLVATITAVDINSKQPITRDIGSPSFAGKTGDFTTYQEFPAAETVIALTVSPALCVYIKNLHATGTVLVKWTPQGGVEASIATLQPGGVLILWNPSTSGSAGITSLKVTPSVANCPIEYYIGG